MRQSARSSATHRAAVKGSNFHLAFLFLPAFRRRALEEFYAFCHYADEVVDGPQSAGRPAQALDDLRNEIGRAFRGVPKTPMGYGLTRLAGDFQVDQKDLLEILRGCQMDLTKKTYQTYAELEDYCACVASAVGLVSIRIFGCTEEKSRAYAIALGKAFQLTNILRDLREDLERGRVYLPQAELERFHYSVADLRRGENGHGFQDLMAFQTARVLDYFREADINLSPPDARALAPAEVMRAVYFEIFRRIRENPKLVLTERVRISVAERILYGLSAYFSSI
jgi:phytoene synthase